MKSLSFYSLLLLCSCNFLSNGQSAEKLDVATFEKKLSETSNALLLDVRTPQEFGERHIANAQNIDYNGKDFSTEIEKLDKAKPVFVYCLSGGRSTNATAILLKSGFKKIYNLDGGILAWTNAGNKVVESASEVVFSGFTMEKYLAAVTKEKLVLVDFSAVWCGPCKKLKPIVDKLEKKYAAKLEVLGIDVDQNNVLANEMNITGIPLLVLYKNGKEVWRNMGLIGEKELEAIITSNS